MSAGRSNTSPPFAPGVIEGPEDDGNDFRQENTLSAFVIVAWVVVAASVAVIAGVAGFALRSLGVL